MQLQSLYIKKYKMLENCHVIFVPEEGYPAHYYEYFSNNNFTVLVGENGNGKTTLMSFIAKLFYDLQRFHSRIMSEFILKYKIDHNNLKKSVTLEKENENLFITVENHLPRSLLLEFDRRKGYVIKEHQNHYSDTVTYDEIRAYLPAKIITSVFSMHGEYAVKRNKNFIGDRINENFDIADIYGQNHYQFNSLSKAIHRFLETHKRNTQVVDDLLDLLNLKFSNKILARSRLGSFPYDEIEHTFVEEDYSEEEFDEDFWALRNKFIELRSFLRDASIENSGWIELNQTNYDLLLKYESDDLLYINDIAFDKNGETITLGNMSSGEKMFFIRILSLLSSIKDNSLIIIEEPELHLNPSWTKQIITMLQMLFSEYKVHFLISTHSYSFINSVFPENILFASKKRFSNPDPSINTFLANEVEISNRFFVNSKKLNYVEDKLWQKVQDSSEEEIERMLNYLGDSYTKFKLFNILLEKRGNTDNVES